MARRPDDQRFLTLDDLYAKVAGRRAECRTADVALDVMQVSPTDSGEIILTDGRDVEGLLTNWSFGQLCARAKAPAGYLRTLPAQLATIPLQWSLEHHETADGEGNDARLLVRQNGSTFLSAITSTTYGRIWDVAPKGHDFALGATPHDSIGCSVQTLPYPVRKGQG